MRKSVLLAALGGSLAALLPGAALAGGPAPEPPAVDLLQAVPTVVAVSSSVKGTSDKPEFLVDGDVETAWNSRSGDLHGWVAIRLPRTVQVTAIKLTAGYPKVKPKGDLFVMNQRVRKVRVLRDNQPVGEYTLDPEQRGLQTLPVRVAGGDLRIEVLETLPGTKPSWRELCISELQVLGTVASVAVSPPAGTAAAPVVAAAASAPVPQRPVVRVGSLDIPTRKGPLALTELTGPFESPEAFAKAQGGVLREPKSAGTTASLAVPSAPFVAVRIIALGSQCRLGIQTVNGWYFSEGLAACSEGAAAAATPGSAAARPAELSAVSQLKLYPSAEGQSPVLLTELLLETPRDPPDHSSGGSCDAELYVCGIGSSGRPSCTAALSLGHGYGQLCGSIDGESEWSWRYRAGWLRTGRLAADLDENASLGPTECEGRRSECARAAKEKRRQIRDNVPDEAKALAKTGAVMFP